MFSPILATLSEIPQHDRWNLDAFYNNYTVILEFLMLLFTVGFMLYQSTFSIQDLPHFWTEYIGIFGYIKFGWLGSELVVQWFF